MRISERQRYHTTNTRVEKARATNSYVLDKLSTLKKINKISDDPIGASQVLRGRDRIKNLQQFRDNVEFAKGFLERSENAISGIGENLMRAKELGVNLANGVYDDKARKAASLELKQLMNEIVSLANTTFVDRHVFSGFRTATPTLSNDGDFLGDDGAVYLQINDDNARQINLQSRHLFEASPEDQAKGHFNMIDALDILYQGLATNDVEHIRHGMQELDYQMEKTTGYQASLGSLTNALNSSLKSLEIDEELSIDEVAKIEEVDMFKASSDFHRTESILQGTLLASNKILQPSLLNFMQ